VRTAYRCRAYPDDTQQQILVRTFGCVRVVWNRTLAERHARYQAEGKGVSYAESDRALTELKKDPDLKRARYPRFKSRHGRQSATYTRSAFRMKDGALWLAKTAAPLHFTWTWPGIDVTLLDPTSVTVTRDPAGRWFVTFQADVPDPVPLPVTGESVGVDVGLKDFAALSTGGKIGHPKDWERHERRLKRYQRRLARCKRGSANRIKAKRKVARAHARITDARRDFLHKASTGDCNAAKNILAAGLAAGAHNGADACGGGVRRAGATWARSPVKQEPQSVRAGIPVL
jgi:putative transposase